MGLVFVQGGVKPGGWIGGIELFGESEIFSGGRIVARLTPGFAEITAEKRPVRLERRRRLQIAPAFFGLAKLLVSQRATEPGAAERTIEGDGAVELVQGRARMVFVEINEAGERECLGVAWRKALRLRQRLPGFFTLFETELQFGQTGPRKTKAWREDRRLSGRRQRFIQPGARLLVVGVRQPLTARGRRAGRRPRLEFHRRNHAMNRQSERCIRGRRREETVGGFNLSGGEFQSGEVNASGIGVRREVRRH